MRVYQENKKNVNVSEKIANNNLLYEKARHGLMELSMSLGIEVMRMLFEQDVEQYAGPKKASTTPRVVLAIATVQRRPLLSSVVKKLGRSGQGSGPATVAGNCPYKRLSCSKPRIL